MLRRLPLTERSSIQALLPAPFLSSQRRGRAFTTIQPPIAASPLAQIPNPQLSTPARASAVQSFTLSPAFLSTPPPNPALFNKIRLRGAVTDPAHTRRRPAFGQVSIALMSRQFPADPVRFPRRANSVTSRKTSIYPSFPHSSLRPRLKLTPRLCLFTCRTRSTPLFLQMPCTTTSIRSRHILRHRNSLPPLHLLPARSAVPARVLWLCSSPALILYARGVLRVP